MVYIVPGLGSHRLAQSALALAELVYKNGFSAVCVSSAFNSEFMENASTAAMPAYLLVDGHDMHVALTEIDQHLNKLYPDRLGDKALMGYSMGALHSLFIADTEPTHQLPLIRFDRFVAINTPVRLLHGVAKLDEFYRAPLDWPGAEQIDNIENTFLKVAALSKSTLTPQTSLPFNAIESKFLVGLTFRLMLRDIIFSSQRRKNQGVLQHPIWNLRRDPVYQEILQYSYHDYFEKFVIPYYWTRGIDSTAQALEKAGDFRALGKSFQSGGANDHFGSAGEFEGISRSFATTMIDADSAGFDGCQLGKTGRGSTVIAMNVFLIWLCLAILFTFALSRAAGLTMPRQLF